MRHIIPFILISLLVIVVFGILQFLNIRIGSYLDWILALASFWWLSIITRFPWDMHFRAKEVLDDAKQSTDKQIPISADEVGYAKKVARRYLLIALALHLFSALGLFLLAVGGVSPVGYVGSVIALLLTLLRPAVRLHEYIMRRLSSISHEFRYPREDVHRLIRDLEDIKARLQTAEYQLNQSEPSSVVSLHQNQLQLLEKKAGELYVSLDQLKLQNLSDHEKLARKAEASIVQISEDAKFLNQVRELIRFFKQA